MSQGSSSVIAALPFITGIIRCTFNKPWSQTGILSYAPVNNEWTAEHYLWLFRSQMSNKSLETINVCEVKYQQQHINPRSKIHSCTSRCQIITVEKTETTSCRVSTDPITIWIMGFSFLFWQGLSISRSCAVFTHWCTVCYKRWIIEWLSQLTFPGKQIHSSRLMLLGSAPSG